MSVAARVFVVVVQIEHGGAAFGRFLPEIAPAMRLQVKPGSSLRTFRLIAPTLSSMSPLNGATER